MCFRSSLRSASLLPLSVLRPGEAAQPVRAPQGNPDLRSALGFLHVTPRERWAVLARLPAEVLKCM